MSLRFKMLPPGGRSLSKRRTGVKECLVGCQASPGPPLGWPHAAFSFSSFPCSRCVFLLSCFCLHWGSSCPALAYSVISASTGKCPSASHGHLRCSDLLVLHRGLSTHTPNIHPEGLPCWSVFFTLILFF